MSEGRKWTDLRWGHSPHLWSPGGCCKTPLWRLPASYRSMGPPARGRLSPDSASDRGRQREKYVRDKFYCFNVQCSDAFSFAWLKFNTSSKWLEVTSRLSASVHTQKPKPHLLLSEVVFDQAAHNLLRRPGSTDMRGDQAAQDTLWVADPSWEKQKTRKTLIKVYYCPTETMTSKVSLYKHRKAQLLGHKSHSFTDLIFKRWTGQGNFYNQFITNW